MKEEWRTALAPHETMALADIEGELEFHRFKAKVLSQDRRAIYARAKKRLAREQKGVDDARQVR